MAKDSVITRDADIEVSDEKAAAVKGGMPIDPIGDGANAPVGRSTSVHSRKTKKHTKGPGKAQGGMSHL
jgi:hypothetical protein